VHFVCWLALLFILGGAAPLAVGQGEITRSPHGPLAIPCENCHTASGWRPIRAVPEFDHNKTNYPLRGMHEKVQCTQCHVKPVFTDVGKNCADCHADIHRRKFGANCAQCHTVRGWQVSVQQIEDHQNRFPLFGAHAAVPCEECHKGAAVGQFQGLSTDCTSCHLKDFQQATNPSHTALNFPMTCQSCHTADSWLGAKFDHLKFTGYALTGAHATIDCVACHVGGKYQGTPTDCYSCHVKDYNGTNNPPHAQAGIPTTCSTCHSTAAWSPAQFDHSKTVFPLTGAHVSVPCSSCHINGNFTTTPTDCYSCHTKDYNGTNNPNHAQAGIPTTCVMCHSMTAWQPASFDHSKTVFPLTGAHVNVACTSCHTTGNYASTPTDCYACHTKDYNGTNNPPHASSGIPTTCAVCHSTTAWQPATFDHSKTVFPLTGAHVTVPCASCHINGNYTTTPTDCYGCHAKDYDGTTSPPHAAAAYPTTCLTCHTTANWTSSSWNHSRTGFALTGFHTTIACTACHVNNNYSLTNPACSACHMPDYNGTTSPPHAAAGYPTDCTMCHSTTNWTSSTWNHSSTGFALTGFHTTILCSACHVNNNYALSNPACSACHMPDYNGTTNPPHAASGFPTTCDTCHSTTDWTGATFDHSKTIFPLLGAHLTVPCASCHVNNNYTTVPTDCWSCHQTDYNNTASLGSSGVPNHITLNYPQTCLTCHNMTNWLGATFNHTWFQIPHHSAQCSNCHINSADYTVFSCTATCHAKSQTDSDHQGVSGYSYGPTTCYSCHKS
jgi:hypothetical protein